jgi:hypothetical protein
MASPSILRIERCNYALAGVAVLAGLISQSREIALGLAVGAGLTCANFFVLRKLVVKWTADTAAGRTSYSQMLAAPKMLVMMLAVVGAILYLPIDPIAFAIGYSIFIPSIVIEATYTALRSPDAPEDTHG